MLSTHLFYATQLPAGDLADRFGLNFNAGASVDYLSKKNYIIGIEGGFLFGNKVKEKVLSNITSDDNIIGNNMTLANYALRERGLYFNALVGKLFPLPGKNKRSGIRTTINIGFLQHKIRLQQDPDSKVFQFEGEYQEGYDRLSNGLAITEFIGYQHLSNNRGFNFFFGFEFTQAFTQNRRNYNFNEMRKDDTKRKDLLLGLKIGWTLPFYIGEEADEIFY